MFVLIKIYIIIIIINLIDVFIKGCRHFQPNTLFNICEFFNHIFVNKRVEYLNVMVIKHLAVNYLKIFDRGIFSLRYN